MDDRGAQQRLAAAAWAALACVAALALIASGCSPGDANGGRSATAASATGRVSSAAESGGTAATGSAATKPAAQPPATSPPATSPPATSPPATAPPATPPPATAPPGADANWIYGAGQPVADGPNGQVLAKEQIAGPPKGRAWRILYRSHALDGRPVAVSGLVVQPDRSPPDGGWPVLTWAHGTTGSADRCAPSHAGVISIPNLGALLDAGYVVAATDYEGLGTPGPHPYLVGASEGRSVLDAARAARSLVPGATGDVVVWGHSQGGQAAVWAGELAAGYAPELPVVGVAAFAPAARLDDVLSAGASPLTAGFEAAAVAGLAAALPELHPADVLVPAALAHLDILERACIASVLTTFGVIPGGVLRADGLQRPEWQAALDANEAGERRSAAPVLVLQGDDDVLVRPAASLLYQRRACAAGSSVELRRYPGVDHGEVVSDALRDALDWSADRVDGKSLDAKAVC